jgi:hypothetical protein
VNIKPWDTTVRALLESGFYKIPRFQRPYSWDMENVNDFWQDTVVAEDEDYFIGSFVVYTDRTQQDLFLVVDGQQRLTTITLAYAALRDLLLEMWEKELARGIHKLVERPDINNQNQFVLQSETPYPYLQEVIQKFGGPDTPVEPGAEERALQRAYDFLRAKLGERLKSVEIDSTIGEDRKHDCKRDALLSIRDKLLRLKLIVVQLDNDDDAYLIFETLNTRGKDLTVSDLVKNHLTRLLRPKTAGVDTAKDRWLGIQERFDEATPEIDINSFILHSWLSRYPHTSKKKLFKDIKAVATASNASQFLDNLVRDSVLYRKLLEPDGFQWGPGDRAIRDAIVAMNLFRVAQPLPMMLALLRAYEGGALTRKQAEHTFSAMENFHVQFTAVTSQRTGGGTAQMYASSARQLVEAHDKNARMSVLREFIEKLRQRIPVYEEFEANFGEIQYTSGQTKQKPLVRYLLRRFDMHWRAGREPVDYDQLTVEHIAPEARGPTWDVSAAMLGKLGNLTFVTQDLNNRLRDRPFDEKISVMKEAGVPMDKSLSEATGWGDEDIQRRTKELARLGYEQVFRL